MQLSNGYGDADSLADKSQFILSLVEQISDQGIQHFYDGIRKKFFKSDEYNWHEYLYRDYADYRNHILCKRSGEHSN